MSCLCERRENVSVRGSLGESKMSLSSIARPSSWTAWRRIISALNASPASPTSPMPLLSKRRREDLKGRMCMAGRDCDCLQLP